MSDNIDLANWQSGDFVGTNLPEGQWLTAEDVLTRIATAFRHVVIDWEEGERKAQARFAKAVEVGYDGVLLESEKYLLGRTVFVAIAEGIGNAATWVRFYLTPHPES